MGESVNVNALNSLVDLKEVRLRNLAIALLEEAQFYTLILYTLLFKSLGTVRLFLTLIFNSISIQFPQSL